MVHAPNAQLWVPDPGSIKKLGASSKDKEPRQLMRRNVLVHKENSLDKNSFMDPFTSQSTHTSLRQVAKVDDEDHEKTITAKMKWKVDKAVQGGAARYLPINNYGLWMGITIAVGQLLALTCVLLWSSVGYGEYLLLSDREWLNANDTIHIYDMISFSLVGSAIIIMIVLYTLDFFTAPHYNYADAHVHATYVRHMSRRSLTSPV